MTDQRPSPSAIGGWSALALLGVLALLAVRSALSWVTNLRRDLASTLHSPHARPLYPVVAALLLLLLVGAAGLAFLRVRATRRTLRSRVSHLVLPTEDFDPSEEAVLRAASQLSRVRRAVLGWFDVRASAVRLRLDSGPDGRMLCRVEVAGRARSAVRSAITSMGAVELREETASATSAEEARR